MITNRVTTIAVSVLIAVMIGGLCGCEQIINIFVSSTDGKDSEVNVLDGPVDVEIGLVLPLTGVSADAYGFSMQRGFKLAQNQINASLLSPVKLGFITIDDMGTVDGAVDAVQNLVDKGVPAIAGLALSSQVEKAFPIAQRNQVVAISPLSAAAGLSSIGDYIFRVAPATDILASTGVIATHAKLGYEKVALIYDDADLYSRSSNAEVEAALMELGVEVLTTQTIQTGDADFTAQLTAIMESNPQAIFISALAPEVTKIMVQGREVGIPYSSPYVLAYLSEQEAQMAGDAAEGAITFVAWDSMSETAQAHSFVDDYRAKHGTEPDPWAALSYTTLHLLYGAIVKAESIESTAIRDALASVKGFDTPLGEFSFDPNGEARYNETPVVLIVKDGNLEILGDDGM